MDRSHHPTALRRLSDLDHEPPVGGTAAERIAMVWPLSLQAWAFRTGETVEPRVRRDIARVIRGASRVRAGREDPVDTAARLESEGA